jgi:DNA-binding GntR family transcriptional regulator
MQVSLSSTVPPIATFPYSGDTSGPITVTPDQSLVLAESVIRRVVAGDHDRPSIVSKVAIQIGAEIVEGILAPGSDLNSVELARRFKTSRTPIREALLLLEKQGLIAIPPRRRPTVLAFDLDQVREIYEVRGRLLELSAAHIAAHATPADIWRLRHGIADMVRAQEDARAFFWTNVAFHDHITAVGGNRLAKSIVDSLLLRTLLFRRISLAHPNRVKKSLDDHQRLLRAFEENDVNLATAIVRSNHRSAFETVEIVMREAQGAL